MATEGLAGALAAVDWNQLVSTFCLEKPVVTLFEGYNKRLAVWSKQFEQIDATNPALAFVREMQLAGHFVPVLTALALYKAAAGSMRAMLETAMYYSYFRTHQLELATLVRDKEYYLSKAEVIAFHSQHTPGFKECQAKLGLVTAIKDWYAAISAIIHGQIPGQWTVHMAVKDIAHRAGLPQQVADMFSAGEQIVHHWFLCTAGREMWDDLSTTAKAHLVKGIAGDVRRVLKLDKA